MAWKQRVKKHSPKPVLRVLRTIYFDYFTKVSGFADRLGFIGPEEIYNEDYYIKRQNDPWRSDANKIAKKLQDQYDPDSVIDFGCAIGAHLEPFYESGCTVKGVEGNLTALQHSVIPSVYIEHADLRKTYDTDGKYDLVICFEVAEHLPETYADVLVNTLSNAGSTVVMTAATPNQQGTHHVNLQHRDYWIQKFEDRQMSYNEEDVEKFRDKLEVTKTTWIPKNIMIFNSSPQTSD